MLLLRHKEEYFVKYQDIPLVKPTDGLNSLSAMDGHDRPLLN
jgi:hypothetical protein